MFAFSTQRNYWLFSEENDLVSLRGQTNRNFIKKHGANMTPEQQEKHFLSASEEQILIRYYENHLRDFCRKFNPPMPKTTVATGLHYFKRFYLKNSVMDYHPKEMLVTCLYLACKVEEFNVSISQFVANIKRGREKASDIILNNELLLMQQLNYHLTIHNPYRPVDGLMIDIKARYSHLEDPERLRPAIDDFIEKIFLTDSILLYTPSQVALAATLHAASKASVNLDNYVTDLLFSPEHLAGIIEAVRKIRSMAKCVEPIPREMIRAIENKLEKCRNQENNPDSEIYKQRMQEMLDDEDLIDNQKYAKIIKDQEAHNEKILEVTRVSSP